MKNSMTKQQIEWASGHDWFVKIDNEGKLIVRDEYSLNGIAHSKEVVWEKSFSELLEFAGY